MPTAPRFIGRLKLFVRNDAEETRRFFAEDISRKLKKFLDEKRDVLFLTSGGSALDVLDRIDPSALTPAVTIGIFDERWDPTNRTSNYAQVRKTQFYLRAVERGCRLIDTSTAKDATQQALADLYEMELHDWRERHPSGVIMATIGVAVDGHTAGIMPYPEDPARFDALFEGERWIVAYDASGKNAFPFRVTTTFRFLRMVDLVGVFMVGAEKGVIFKRVLEDGPLSELPGRIIKELPRGAVYVDLPLLRSAGYATPS